MTAAALAFAIGSPASAAVFTVNFDVAGDWSILDTGLPFTLTGSPVLHGNFSFDDSTWEPVYTGDVDYKQVVAVNFNPGNQVWALGDVASASFVRASSPGGPVISWFLNFDNIASPNSAHINFVSNTQTFLYDGVNSAACSDCVTWSVSEGLPGPVGVPEPTTWAMMILGFGLVGSAIRGRRQAARFQP